MTHYAKHTVAVVMRDHSITIVEGHLTIRGEKTLTPEETEQLLDALMIWRYGLDPASSDDLEADH
jgi:hypothetical protein